MAKQRPSGLTELTKKKIRDTLTSARFGGTNDVVEVRDGDFDDLYLRVVSPKFAGMRPLKRIDLVWSILEDNLKPEEWGQITMTETETPPRKARSRRRS